MAAVVLVEAQAEPVEPEAPVAVEGRAEPAALVEQEAVAEPEELAGLAGLVAAEAQELRAVEVVQGQRLSTIRTIR